MKTVHFLCFTKKIPPGETGMNRVFAPKPENCNVYDGTPPQESLRGTAGRVFFESLFPIRRGGRLPGAAGIIVNGRMFKTILYHCE